MAELPLCLYHQDRQSSKLVYYSKTYPNNKSTLESPIFCCDECSPKAIKDLDICRGGIEGIKSHSFKQIGKMKEKEIGWLTSKRGWEINHLATKVYRDLLFSIHYLSLPSKKETLVDSLQWYKKILDKQIDIANFDRRLSAILDCVDFILRDLEGGASGE